MRQLTSLDAQFLAMETPRTYGHVAGLSVYDPSTAPGGTLTIDDVRRLISERLHLLPPFRWRLVSVPFDLDHPYWMEDPDFDLDFHVRETAVPRGDREPLAELVARVAARPLDRAHPLWELYLIYGLKHGRVGMLTKIHHAAVDGMSGAEILTILLDTSPEGREIPSAPPHRAEREPSQLEMLGRGAPGRPLPADPRPARPALGARQPRGPARRRPHARGQADRPGRDAGAAPAARGPRGRHPGHGRGAGAAHALQRAHHPHRRFAFGSASLERIKAIKDALGITVNDASSSACARLRCAPGCSSRASCPTTRWSRWCRCPCAPRSRPARSATACR